jgi:hypothetical protein
LKSFEVGLRAEASVGGWTARGGATQGRSVEALREHTHDVEYRRAADVGEIGWFVVVEDDEADADLVAVEHVVALDAERRRAKIEVHFRETALARDEKDEDDEEPGT